MQQNVRCERIRSECPLRLPDSQPSQSVNSAVQIDSARRLAHIEMRRKSLYAPGIKTDNAITARERSQKRSDEYSEDATDVRLRRPGC
jgi:hypothetical protein